MAKIKYTKNELKKQKDDLKRFTRYLPTLELKKQQLLVEIRNIRNSVKKLRDEIERIDKNVKQWADVFAEPFPVDEYIAVKELKLDHGNIAGIDIPVFNDVVFEEKEYDDYTTPLWVDRGIDAVKQQIRLRAEIQVAEKQEAIIREELRVTIQRIKLFEEIKIPEAKENIRMIRIFLGDLQTAEVVRGKIAKKKIEKKKLEGRAA